MIGERSVEIVHNGGYNTTPLGLTPASRRLSRLLAAEPPCCAGSHTLRRTNVSVSAKTRERRRLTEVAEIPTKARLTLPPHPTGSCPDGLTPGGSARMISRAQPRPP